MLIECDFTTTGPVERLVSSLAILGVLKNYYNFTCSACGIRNVYFAGTLEDWLHVREKTEALASYNFEWWVPEIVGVLNEFISTFKGQPNVEFWNKLMKTEGNGDSGEYDEISGWAKTFYPYDIKGERYTGPLHLNDIPRISFSVPFKLIDLLVVEEMIYMGGFSGIRLEEQVYMPTLYYSLMRVRTELEAEEYERLRCALSEEEQERAQENSLLSLQNSALALMAS